MSWFWKRLSWVCAAVVSVSGAGSALAATRSVDLAVTATGPTTPVSYGSTIPYVIQVTNNGPSHASMVKLDVALPAGTQFVSADTATCTLNAPTDLTFSCTVGTDPLIDGSSVLVNFTTALPIPTPAPTACPAANSVGALSVHVSSTDATEADPAAANDTATAAVTTGPYADVGVTLTGPGTAKPGDSIQFQNVVTNNGPCTSASVALTLGASKLLSLVSTSMPCDATGNCALGDLASGATVTVTTTYTVQTLPAQLSSTGAPNGVSVASSPSGANAVPTPDPNPANDSASTKTLVTHSVGCSAAGAPSALMLLGMGALLAVTRRKVQGGRS